MPNQQSRRAVLKNILAGSAAIGASSMLPVFAAGNQTKNDEILKFKGNINHSVCQWCYNFLPLEELCKLVKSIGFNAIVFISSKAARMIQKYGIYSSMCYTNGDISLTKVLIN